MDAFYRVGALEEQRSRYEPFTAMENNTVINKTSTFIFIKIFCCIFCNEMNMNLQYFLVTAELGMWFVYYKDTYVQR